MFERLTVRGGVGELLWGYRATATLRSWTITKENGKWRLSGTLERADRFQCSQAITRNELLFTAPRDKGRWCWPIVNVELGTSHVTGVLGPPLQ